MQNVNLNSAKKISKVIKQSLKLVLSIWQGQGLDKLPTPQAQEPERVAAAEDQEVPDQETSKSQEQEKNDSS